MAKSRPSGAIRLLNIQNQNAYSDSAKEWDSQFFPPKPDEISPSTARTMLEAEFWETSINGEKVKFGREIIDHWQNEEKYDDKQINGRLSRLEMARAAVKNPAEIWDQGKQTAFVQAFKKKTGGKQAVVVFVNNQGIAFTYFPKDTNALDKVRKGNRVYQNVLK